MRRTRLAFVLILAFSFAGIGVMLSSYAETMREAVTLSNLVKMPMMLLCGVFFPRNLLPPSLKLLTEFLPLTYAVEALRAVMVKGAGFSQIMPDIAVLLVFGVVTLLLGARVLGRAIEE